MSIKNRLLPLAMLAAVLAAAVVMAVGSTREAPEVMAHTGTGQAHIEIDADPTNGGGPCDPAFIDASRTVFAGDSFQVAICLGDSDQAPINGLLNTSSLFMNYSGAFISAPNEPSDLTLDLDSNPDFDQAAVDQAAQGTWDCNQVNALAGAPVGNPSPAKVDCTTSDANNTVLDTPYVRLATVDFDAVTAGISNLTWDNSTNLLSGVTNPQCDVDIICHDADIEVLPAADLELTKSCTPTNPAGGDSVDCTLTVTNHGPDTAPNVLILDNLPDDKIYNDAATEAANGGGPNTCSVVNPALIGGMLNVISCGTIGIGVDTPIALLNGQSATLHVVYDVPVAAANKEEQDAALAFATAGFGIPVNPFPDPNLNPVIEFIASQPPCNATADPVFCAGLALIDNDTQPVYCGAGSVLGPLGTPCDNAKRFTVNVQDADVTITKDFSVPTAQLVEGDTPTYIVTVDVNPGTAASSVIIDDTVDGNQTITNVGGVNPGYLSVPGTCVVANPTITCTLANPILPTDPPVTLAVSTTVDSSVGNVCENDATVTFADPVEIADGTSVPCFPPSVRMQKDAGLDSDLTIEDEANLFLCIGTDSDGNGFADEDGNDGPALPNASCEAYDSVNGEIDNNGNGHLVVFERLFNQNDPDGAGAFEFQLKFDHKIFDIEIFHGVDLNGDGDCTDNGEDQAQDTVDACYLYQTGRVPNWTGGVGGCDMTIVNENFILFGCVSKNPEPAPGDPVVITPGPQGSSDVVATIHISPEPDLKFRLTPGQKNGVLRTILDENCEVADIFGDPLSSGAVDELGRQIPLIGIVTGGLVEACDDLTVTSRILEGDLDLDCQVDVADDQQIAFRYGSFFGNLLYDPWFDLEPSLKDFDVDIKDLQKVFGRNGSTCEEPIPAQPAQSGGGFSGAPDPGPLP
jgi:uncharacterized repeat protein (TIGR01451 family)